MIDEQQKEVIYIKERKTKNGIVKKKKELKVKIGQPDFKSSRLKERL